MQATLPLRDLEQSLVGAAFLDASIMTLVQTAPEEFHDLRAGYVWGACRALEAAGKPIDMVTVESQLATTSRMESVGFVYLGECALRCPTPDNAVEYARQIRDAFLARRVRGALSDVLERGKRDESSGVELLSMALAALAGLDADQPDEAMTIGQLVRARVKDLERIADERLRGVTTLTGFPTGVLRLDGVTGGWQPGIVSIVAARPGMGKSSLGMSTADACSAAGVGVHVFSLEDTRASYTDRALSRVSQVPSETIRGCDYRNGEMSQLSNAMTKLILRRGWMVDDRSGITAEELVRSVRRHRRENATRVVLVDYVQLLQWPKHCRSAHEAITASVTTLADAAKHDGIAYVVMSQLNRQVEQRTDKRPQLSDLRESGSLEERAKCVVGLYRGSYYGEPKEGVDYESNEIKPTGNDWAAMAQLLVLKNSNGRTGNVHATWHGPTTRLS